MYLLGITFLSFMLKLSDSKGFIRKFALVHFVGLAISISKNKPKFTLEVSIDLRKKKWITAKIEKIMPLTNKSCNERKKQHMETVTAASYKCSFPKICNIFPYRQILSMNITAAI